MIRNTEKDRQRLNSMYDTERSLTGNAPYVFGIDEAGRGPLCGPVSAACCLLRGNIYIPGLNDSKKLSENTRNDIYAILTEDKNICTGHAFADEETIDRINILQATLAAMSAAFSICLEDALKKGLVPQEAVDNGDILVIVDGNRSVPDIVFPQKTITGGDAKCPSISAASVIAKVTRDRLMYEYDQLYPGYGFAKNKGYGTAEHLSAIREKGILPIHRRTFLKNIIK